MIPEKEPELPVVEQFGILTETAAKASHLPPETVTGVAKETVMGPAELSVKLLDPIRVVGEVPRPLSS